MANKKSTGGFIYLAHAETTNDYKIGRTTNVFKRMKQLNGSQASNKIVLVKYVPVEDTRREEKKLHGMFLHRKKHNEWFTLSESDVELLCMDMDYIKTTKPLNYKYKSCSGVEKFEEFCTVFLQLIALCSVLLLIMNPTLKQPEKQYETSTPKEEVSF